MVQKFDSKDSNIHWVAEVPVAKLARHLDGLLPPGDWIRLADYKDLLQAVGDQLFGLKSKVIKGDLMLLIARGMHQMALVEILPPQRDIEELPSEKIESKRGNSSDRGQKPDETPIVASDDIAKAAILASESILSAFRDGAHVDAEGFLKIVGNSPDPGLTRNALRQAGEGIAVYGNSVSFNPKSYPKCPNSLISSETYRMRISDYGVLETDRVKATFEMIHSPGKPADLHICDLLEGKRRAPIDFSACADAVLFRLCVAAGVSAEVDVSVTISTFENAVERLTLVRLAKQDQALAELERVLSPIREQLQLQLE